MRKCFAAALIASAACGAFAGGASASQLFYEPFNYPDGPLATSLPSSGGNTNPTSPSSVTVNSTTFNNTNLWSTGGHSANVVDGDLSYPNLPSISTGHMAQLSNVNRGPDRIAVGNYLENSTIWFSMLLEVPSDATTFGSNSTTGSFLAGFQYNPTDYSPSTTMTDTTAGAGGVLTVRKNASNTAFNLGIGYRDITATTSRVFDSTDLSAGTTYFVVGSYTINAGDFNDVAKLWIDPDPTATDPGTPGAISDNSVINGAHDYFYNNSGGLQIDDEIRSFMVRSNGVEPTHIDLDDIRVGSSYSAVTSIPEPASLSLLGLGGLGLLSRRRRRK